MTATKLLLVCLMIWACFDDVMVWGIFSQFGAQLGMWYFGALTCVVHVAEEDRHCTLTLTDYKIGEIVRRAGLYVLYPTAPFVKPLVTVAIGAKDTEVVLPITGRQFVDAMRNSRRIEMGLYTQYV